jgi:hypothetical protein
MFAQTFDARSVVEASSSVNAQVFLMLRGNFTNMHNTSSGCSRECAIHQISGRRQAQLKSLLPPDATIVRWWYHADVTPPGGSLIIKAQPAPSPRRPLHHQFDLLAATGIVCRIADRALFNSRR